jgi:hypothetical protein
MGSVCGTDQSAAACAIASSTTARMFAWKRAVENRGIM